MNLPSDSPLIGAVDIGGTKIAVGLIDSEGKIRARQEFPTYPDGGFDRAIRRISDSLRKLSEGVKSQILGIGIGATGPVDPLLGAFGKINFMPAWEGRNPVEMLSRDFGVQVGLENDADAAALGEAHWGAARGCNRLAYVTVGTGIGVALIIDGQIYRGLDGAHPEIGHHTIDPAGPLCSCGSRGCWEAFAAGPAMVNWLQAQAPDRFPASADLTAKRICEIAAQGDAWARRAVEQHSRYLGIGLANVIAFFVPDTIVLGGSVMNSLPLFIDGIRKEILDRCSLVPAANVELKAASLGKDAALAGAASVWYHRFARNGE